MWTLLLRLRMPLLVGSRLLSSMGRAGEDPRVPRAVPGHVIASENPA